MQESEPVPTVSDAPKNKYERLENRIGTYYLRNGRWGVPHAFHLGELEGMLREKSRALKRLEARLAANNGNLHPRPFHGSVPSFPAEFLPGVVNSFAPHITLLMQH
jgi:hypothetical protein